MTDHPRAGAELSVIIPTRERWERLNETLDGLREQTVQGFEVIVVVDGLDEAPPELPDVRVIRRPHAGPGVARNHAVAQCDRPLVLFLGDDMVPARGLVEHHLAHHDRNPERHVAVLGRAVWHPAVRADRLHRWLGWSGALFDFPDAADEAVPDAGWQRFYSCNVSMKRDLFEATGGFDPDFVFDYEDLDLAWRLARQGMRLIYEPLAIARHHHEYDWGRVVARYESRARAERVMMAKHDWFSPWFHDQVVAAQNAPPVSRVWTLLADVVPGSAPSWRSRARRRADRHYLQRIAPAFLAAWNATSEPARRPAGVLAPPVGAWSGPDAS